MKITFPTDYWDYIRTYGSGSFAFERGRVLQIYNPFSRLYQEHVTMLCENYRGFRIGEGRKAYPYKVYPTKGGILPVGLDGGGNELYWITKSDPSGWLLMLRSSDNESEEFDEPLTAFLAKVFSGRVEPEQWPEFDSSNAVSFVHEATPPGPDFYPTSIQELYRQNGNQAGFWITHVHQRPGQVDFVKSVGGFTSGPLVWPFNHVVIVDSFFNDELDTRDLAVTTYPGERSYLLATAPPNIRVLPT